MEAKETPAAGIAPAPTGRLSVMLLVSALTLHQTGKMDPQRIALCSSG